MSATTSFNESDHPREGDGKFAAKDAPESEASLGDEHDPDVDGDWYPTRAAVDADLLEQAREVGTDDYVELSSDPDFGVPDYVSCMDLRVDENGVSHVTATLPFLYPVRDELKNRGVDLGDEDDVIATDERVDEWVNDHYGRFESFLKDRYSMEMEGSGGGIPSAVLHIDGELGQAPTHSIERAYAAAAHFANESDRGTFDAAYPWSNLVDRAMEDDRAASRVSDHLRAGGSTSRSSAAYQCFSLDPNACLGIDDVRFAQDIDRLFDQRLAGGEEVHLDPAVYGRRTLSFESRILAAADAEKRSHLTGYERP